MDKATFFAEVRERLFGGAMTAGQVAGCESILDAWDRWAPHSDLRWIANSLGTVYHECSRTMQPIREIGKGKGRPYGVPDAAGRVYYGRGFVQLTWAANYKLADKRLHEGGVLGAADSLVANPDLALRDDVAAAILVLGMVEGWFTHRKLSDYFAGTRSDWVDARRIINGSDRAALVASYGMAFYHALQSAQGNSPAAPAPSPVAAKPAPAAPSLPPKPAARQRAAQPARKAIAKRR